jgi:hypothetical protein
VERKTVAAQWQEVDKIPTISRSIVAQNENAGTNQTCTPGAARTIDAGEKK